VQQPADQRLFPWLAWPIVANSVQVLMWFVGHSRISGVPRSSGLAVALVGTGTGCKIF